MSSHDHLLAALDWIVLGCQSLVFLALGYAVFLMIMRIGYRRGIHMRY